MRCYFQGCAREATTTEHIPPRSFFPDDDTVNLKSIKSCPEHNESKSKNDLYALAHITLSAIENQRASDIFEKSVRPQLAYRNRAFEKTISQGSVRRPDGMVEYQVDEGRLNEFFTALSCEIVFKVCKKQLTEDFIIHHVYANLVDREERIPNEAIQAMESLYGDKPSGVLDFGSLGSKNERIYQAKLFGRPSSKLPHNPTFEGSITIVHLFYGLFRVTSFLSKISNQGSTHER